jgi:hypothetical protein
MGPALLLIAQLYRVEKRARGLAPADRFELRQLETRPILDKLHQYLRDIQLVTSIAAAFGTAANSPVTSAGHSGQPWQESFVAMGFLTVAIAIIATSILVLWGLRGTAAESNDSWKHSEFNIPREAEGRRS